MPTARINDHDMYWETHGTGEPALCMGGWGTFAHGGHPQIPRALSGYETLVLDYRGIGESEDVLAIENTTKSFADDAIALCEHLGWSRVRILGMVGIGGCVAQEMAIARPDLVRAMALTGTWAQVDATFRDQLELFADVHELAGFAQFQKLAAAYSFEPAFYAVNRERVLGDEGAWSELRGRMQTHRRLVNACLSHDSLDRLNAVVAPTLVVHGALDVLTGPRLTKPIETHIPNARGELMADVAHVIAGREQKKHFSDIVGAFMAGVPA